MKSYQKKLGYCTKRGAFKLWDKSPGFLEKTTGFIDEYIYEGAGEFILGIVLQVLDGMLEGAISGGSGGTAIAVAQALAMLITSVDHNSEHIPNCDLSS